MNNSPKICYIFTVYILLYVYASVVLGSYMHPITGGFKRALLKDHTQSLNDCTMQQA